mgnify:CR=1 FL=1
MIVIDCFEDIYNILYKCKFIQNNNRKSLAYNKGGFSNPVGLKYDYIKKDYAIPRFDEVNGEEVFIEISKFIDRWLKEKKIDFRFNTLTINKNFACNYHIDQNNMGESLLFTVGDFVGGRLMMQTSYDGEDFVEFIDIHNKPFIFKGNQIKHKTEDFNGLRFCIVAYWI